MLPRFINILILLVCAFVFSNCNKCKNLYKGTITLSTADLKIIPYTNQIKLIFISNSSDSLSLSKIKLSNTQENVTENPNENSTGCLKYYICDDYGYLLSDSLSAYRIDLGILFRGYPPSKALGLSIAFPLKDSIINFFNLFFLQNDSIPGNYYQTIQIGERQFSNVHELSTGNVSLNFDYFKFAYYSTKQGIVGFKSNKGKVWYLAN